MSQVEELKDAVKRGDWPAYFRALGGRHTKVKRADLELPPPEHTSRQDQPEEPAGPTGATRLVKVAQELGWAAQTQYARGHRWGVGTAMVLVHSAAVRLQDPRTGRNAVALWEAKAEAGKLKWTTDEAWRWSTTTFPVKVGVEELKTWMREAA